MSAQAKDSSEFNNTFIKVLEAWKHYVYDLDDPASYSTRRDIVKTIDENLKVLDSEQHKQEFIKYGYDSLIKWEPYFPAFLREVLATMFPDKEIALLVSTGARQLRH